MTQMAFPGPVDELDCRVEDRLGVDQHRDPVVIDVEQMMSLDHLQSFVEQRGGVDGYPRAHVHVGWASASSGVTPASSRDRPRNGPPNGQDQPRYRLRILTGEALEQGRVLAVDRDQLTAVLGQGSLHHRSPATRLSLFARARDFPHSRPARVALNPAAPTMPLTTMVPGSVLRR